MPRNLVNSNPIISDAIEIPYVIYQYIKEYIHISEGNDVEACALNWHLGISAYAVYLLTLWVCISY